MIEDPMPDIRCQISDIQYLIWDKFKVKLFRLQIGFQVIFVLSWLWHLNVTFTLVFDLDVTCVLESFSFRHFDLFSSECNINIRKLYFYWYFFFPTCPRKTVIPLRLSVRQTSIFVLNLKKDNPYHCTQ